MPDRARPKPLVGITLGDPAGVGPEVTVKALADPVLRERGRFVVLGSFEPLRQAVALTGSPLTIRRAATAGEAAEGAGTLSLLDVGDDTPASMAMGRLSAEAGRLAVAYIREAARLAMGGELDAICTAPVNKEAIELSGEHFTGHTELLAELTGAPKVSMLLVSGSLRVAHVSTHVSLARAIELVRPERIADVVELVAPALRLLGFDRPRIALAGLNPHAGEHGLFGSEDAERIQPAVQRLRGRGLDVSGPYPPDSVFERARRGEFDAVIAMYHDQGHIAVKMADFFGGVNVTLGLPVIRTSVDHGTGFDIAGEGIANPASMVAALALALDMAERRPQTDRGA